MIDSQHRYPYSKGTAGFSLVELITIMALMAILSAIALPSLMDWVRSMKYRQATSEVQLVLREAKNKALTTNLQHIVEFTPASGTYRLRRGNQAYDTTSTNWTTLQDYKIDSNVAMKSGNCTVTTNVAMQFNPNGTVKLQNADGTASSGIVCIQDSNAALWNRITVTAIGRISAAKN